jgi:hypothetical protein
MAMIGMYDKGWTPTNIQPPDPPPAHDVDEDEDRPPICGGPQCLCRVDRDGDYCSEACRLDRDATRAISRLGFSGIARQSEEQKRWIFELTRHAFRAVEALHMAIDAASLDDPHRDHEQIEEA